MTAVARLDNLEVRVGPDGSGVAKVMGTDVAHMPESRVFPAGQVELLNCTGATGRYVQVRVTAAPPNMTVTIYWADQ